MLLRDLITVPRLQLRLLHEPAGALDQPVRRVMTTDLLEPARYLSGGELVISGMIWRRTPQDSETFVAGLVEGGAIALAAGDALLGSVPEDVVDACRRHDLALLEVPVEIAFADVVEHLAEAARGESGARLSASLVRQRQLLSAVASGRSLDEVAARVSLEIKQVCRVLTSTGRQVVPGLSPLTAEELDRVTATFLKAERLPAVSAPASRAGTAYSLFTVGPALGNRLGSWIVAVEGRWPEWDEDAVEAVHEFAAIASLDRARRDEGLRAVRHIAEDALAMADSGGSRAEIAMRLRQVGLDPAGSILAVVADLSGRPELVEVARAVVDDIALDFGPPVVGVDSERRVVALLVANHDTEQLLRAAFGRLAPGLRNTSLSVGLSSPSAPAALSGALEEARYARRVAQARGAPVSVVSAAEVTSHVILLATVPDDVRRTFASRVLGRVLDYDTRNDADLVRSLEVFLECSGSWSRAAEALHVHVNTVRYRIERVEELTRRDLGRLEDRVDVFLALRSL